MSSKTVITCALTGVLTNPAVHNVPVTPEEMADHAQQAFNAGASVVHCHFRNQDKGIDAIRSTVTSNTVHDNNNIGINAVRCTVTNNTVTSNGFYSTDAGIVVSFSCLAEGNTLYHNRPYNIRVSGRYSTIEENLVTDGDTGIYVSNTDNLIIKK